MIAHYRKSRDKFSRAVAREATELLGGILKLLWGNSEADSRWILIWQNSFAGMNFQRRNHPCYEVTIVKRRL